MSLTTPSAQSVKLVWEALPQEEYCLHLHLHRGKGVRLHGRTTHTIENAVGADKLRGASSYVFDGRCVSHPQLDPIPLESIRTIELNSTGGSWGDRDHRHAAVVEYHGQEEMRFLFPTIVRWPTLPDAEVSMEVVNQQGEVRPASAVKRVPGEQGHVVFTGFDPTQSGNADWGRAAIKELRLVAHRADDAGDPLETVVLPFDPSRRELWAAFESSPVAGLRSRLLFPGLADPDILADETRFIVSGTDGENTARMPIYVADKTAPPDQVEYRLLKYFHPNQPGLPEHDPAYRYFHLWGPELTYSEGVYTMYVSAFRETVTPENPEPGWPRVDDRVTMFKTEAHSPELEFGPLVPLDTGKEGFPKHTLGLEPPATSGTPYQMKIDTTFLEGRLYYTWFHHGNHVASFTPEGEEPDIIRHADPQHPDEEGINEAPDTIKFKGNYYFFFSLGTFHGNYRIGYMFGPDQRLLTRDQSELHYLTSPVFHPVSGRLLENLGHNATVEYDGRVYIIYHKGYFRDGVYWHPRDTWIAPLVDRPDGTFYELTY